MEVPLSSYAAVAAQDTLETLEGGNHHHNNSPNRKKNSNSVSAYERLLHPKPESWTLIAALQLLQPLAVGDTVYLLPVPYVQNWLQWAYQQGCCSDAEQARAREALKQVALQLHLLPPTDSEMDVVEAPGPMDAATSLAVQGHKLVLQPTVRLHRGHVALSDHGRGHEEDEDAENKNPPNHRHSFSPAPRHNLKPPPSSPNNHHHSALLSSPHSIARQSSTPQMKLPPTSPKSVDRRGAQPPAPNSLPRQPLQRSNSRHSMEPRRNGNSSTPTSANGNSNNNNAPSAPECLAVPEAFYTTLRSVHGVLCQDGYTVSFQQPSSAVAGDQILLHHEAHNRNSQPPNGDVYNPPSPMHALTMPLENGKSSSGSNYNRSSSPPTLTTNSHDATPVEFRRKVIARPDSALKKYTDAQLEHMSLMERLMIEEERRHQPRRPTPEIHPIKLLYRVQDTTRPHGKYDGFVLVSREAVAVSALQAMLRAAAPKAANETVRLWSFYHYPWEGRTSPLGNVSSSSTPVPSANSSLESFTTTAGQPQQKMMNNNGSTADNGGGGSVTFSVQQQQTEAQGRFELIDFAQMMQHDSKATDGPLTIGEWAQRHDVAGTERQIECLIEHRPTVQSPWPRHALELSQSLQVGDCVDAQDVAGKWYEARVCALDADSVTVHYFGWASRWNLQLKRFPHTASLEGRVAHKLHPPAPLWSQTPRWRERLAVGDIIEVRDTSSLVHRPKWYKGEVKRVGRPKDTVWRSQEGGADLELYPVLNGSGGEEGTTTSLTDAMDENEDGNQTDTTDLTDDNTSGNKTGGKPPRMEPLRLLNRCQQILVEVAQERTEKAGAVVFTKTPSVSTLGAGSAVLLPAAAAAAAAVDELESANSLTAEPPFLRWVDLYGEEICQMGTHLKLDDEMKSPSILKYELEHGRKPVEILKSHPSLGGAGFMRESLRGAPPAPGSVGLHNLGNSCFLNSTVQCLNHMELLTQYFLRDGYGAELNRQNPLGSGGNVALAYASLVKKMWSGDYSVLAPRSLKQTVAAFAPQFDNSYQHDSQEFCQFLMDGLHEDLNRVKTKPYVEELEGFGMPDAQAAVESWRKHLLRHDSIFVDHCQGMHRSHLTCPQCGRESIKFDVYSSISLPLASKKDHTAIQLQDCIEMFMEGEQLDERNAWYCPSCRRHVCALKLIALWSAPDVLILHLKRFQFDTCLSSGGMLRTKVDDTVNFPIEGLDLRKFILGPVNPDAPPIYKLFGVSEHAGFTANSGHYTATVRNSIDGQWYRCNDSHVGRTSGEAAITGGAYVLFYQREKGTDRWAGMERVMRTHLKNPYYGNNGNGGANEPVDADGFKRVKTRKKKKSQGNAVAGQRQS